MIKCSLISADEGAAGQMAKKPPAKPPRLARGRSSCPCSLSTKKLRSSEARRSSVSLCPSRMGSWRVTFIGFSPFENNVLILTHMSDFSSTLCLHIGSACYNCPYIDSYVIHPGYIDPAICVGGF